MATGVLVVTTTYHCHSPLQHPVNMATVILVVTLFITVIHPCNTLYTWPVTLLAVTSLIAVIHLCNTQQTWPQSYQLHLSQSFTSATPSKHVHSHINFTYHCHSPLQHPANMATVILVVTLFNTVIHPCNPLYTWPVIITGSDFTHHCHSPLKHPANMATVISTSLIAVIHLCNTQ